MPTPETQQPDTQHFTRAVVELGEARPVISHCAIFNSQGIKIIEKGVAIDERLYDRLMQHQLKTPLEHCVASESGVTPQELRRAVQALMDEDPFFGRMGADPRAREVLLDTMQTLPLPPAIAFQLTLAREVRPQAWQHALRSALTAAWLGSGAQSSRFDVRMLAAAGLLHDLGMLHVDPLLVQREGELTAEQRRQLAAHPLVSVMLIERHHEYPRELVRAVIEHHEMLDGSGYPRNLVADALSPWGRILSLSETVCGMFAPGRDAPQLRLSLLLRMNRHRYDAVLVQRVMAHLEPELVSTLADAVAEPQRHLLAIDAMLAAWPAPALQGPAVPAERRARLQQIELQCEQLRRTLADAGGAPAALSQLGDGPFDGDLPVELSLMAREAAWQLRAITRQARRRWHAAADEAFPPPLSDWLDRADTTVGPLLAD